MLHDQESYSCCKCQLHNRQLTAGDHSLQSGTEAQNQGSQHNTDENNKMVKRSKDSLHVFHSVLFFYFNEAYANMKCRFDSNLEGSLRQPNASEVAGRTLTFNPCCPQRCPSQLLSENSGNGVGWIRYDHCGFLHCQPGCLPGVGPAWGAHHRHQWPEGVCRRMLSLSAYKHCIKCIYIKCLVPPSVFAAEKPIRQVHLRHSETELCGHLLPAASGA